MKKGAILLNVSRGGLVDSEALMAGLENGQLGAVGMDVYENEGKACDIYHTFASVLLWISGHLRWQFLRHLEDRCHHASNCTPSFWLSCWLQSLVGKVGGLQTVP